MKTIAITIAPDTVERLDRFLKQEPAVFRSRSELVRQALSEFLARMERELEEQRERRIFRRERDRLARDTAALIAEQADA